MGYKSTVLIVDDLDSVREVLKGLLTGQGYNLVFASNGREALTKAAQFTPDLILLDVMMPDMDGFEVCQRLRDDPLLAEVPVIMLTALDDTDSRVRGIEVGADDFISKPFSSTELQARVRTTTRLNRYRRLLSARTKFDWVVEQATDGYLVIDNNDKIVYANSQARLFLDLPADQNESPPATFLETARQQYRFEPEQTWTIWPEQPGLQEQSPRYLVRAESPIAKSFWLQVNVLGLPSSVEEGWIVQLRDVTTQVELQRDMWEFETMVSHKLRTPMVGLFSGLHLLKETIPNLENTKTGELYKIVMRGANRLHRAIEDILEYLYTPTLVQSEAGFELNQLQAVVTKLSTDLELESVSLSGHEALDEVQLSLHPQAVELMLGELLENAKKFHPRQTPTVEVSVRVMEAEKQASLKVSDDGVTLSPEQLAQAWTPYYQGDKYFTGELQGMGLGLSRVAMLVWTVGGSCRIYNRPAETGVTVELILPLRESDAGSPS